MKRRLNNGVLSLWQDAGRVVYGKSLKVRRTTPAGYTSGGEQQMIAIGRALMARPALVLLDEPSMGLAPQVVEDIFETVAVLNRDSGVSFLFAELNAAIALRYAQSGYVLENGRWSRKAARKRCWSATFCAMPISAVLLRAA